jgi:hypothetical protein
MKRKLLFSFALLGLAIASAKSYTVTLYETAMLGNMELKPGDYRIEVVDQKAVIRNGSKRGEAPVKVENTGTKFYANSVRLTAGGGTPRIQEIRIGGTRTKLVFE